MGAWRWASNRPSSRAFCVAESSENADAPEEGLLHRFLFEELNIRGAVVQLHGAWQRMHAQRGYPPPVLALLGELAAVATLIAGNLKQPGRLSFQIQGEGPVRILVLDCTAAENHDGGARGKRVPLGIRGMARGEVRGTVRSLSALLGSGRITLTLQPEALPRVWQSVVPLHGDTLAEVLGHYLEQSEQQPAWLFLCATAEAACGLFLQKLPDADDRDPDGWNRIVTLADTVAAGELASLAAEDLLGRLFPGETLRLFKPRPVRYDCPEDWDKVRNMLRALGRDEVQAIVAEHGAVVVRDDICNREYRFDADAIAALLGADLPPPPGVH
ncbi:MAG: Hsp33 family molecular chaperone HslO [Betaproteobacteria bacterium]|nr:Hsp33 family molecular chaperone HslO [Betaproteobacteria bacterium]